jgi:hypothetical protein
VTLGELGEILRLGLDVALAEDGIAVVGDVAAADAIIIDLDADDAVEHAESLMASFPGLTVIACSAERPSMRVMSSVPQARERPLTCEVLSATVRAAAAAR